MDLLADFRARGLIHDSTDIGVLAQRLSDGPIGVYVGFDPTADSLHVGHLLGQIALRRFQLAGHRPFPLAGGATGMVGDPSGRSEERNLLDRETLAANVAAIKSQLERILDFGPGPGGAVLVDNADWTVGVGILEFLRDVGKHFTVNQMTAKESVRARMAGDNGISFTEFSYMLLQANDYRHLCQHHGVELQMGGSDQWGNITAGIDLCRRVLKRTVHGLTWPLLTKADGEKFGKTGTATVWLDPNRTSPYRFHQYWIQTPDSDVERYLLQFTLRTVDEIAEVVAEHGRSPERHEAQRALAADLTTLVHGPEAAAAAEAAAEVLFGADPRLASAATIGAVAREVPGSTASPDQLADVVGLLTATGLATSNGAARRGLSQGAFRANGNKLTGEEDLRQATLLAGRYLLLSRGRKTHHLVEISPEWVDGRRPAG
jgi:tyrosyl-tRNA synthetase